jgi:hypothetical protein
MSVLSKLRSSGVAHAVSHAAGKVGSAAKQQVQAAATTAKQDAMDAAQSAAKTALQKLFGPVFHAQAKLPPYTPLPAGALDAAKARSSGMTHVQRLARDSHDGPHEPVTLAISGTRAQLEAALEQAGWAKSKPESVSADVRAALALVTSNTALGKLVRVQDDASPMSTMYVGGQAQVMAFEKNNDHHQGRDHLRVFATGQTDAQGRPVWEIAASRDLAFDLDTRTLHACHQIDHHVDRERDMVMADLLGTGRVADWHVAQGKRPAAVSDYLARHYPTDGNVYEVSLAG